MAKIKKFPNFVFQLVLVLITSWLCFKNYTSGTFLIGWDSLHPEFNFSEAFRRVRQGVWRGEQGLGVIAAHSHMADLPRMIFLWLESFVIPLSFLRYSYIFLCLIVGPLGVYYFLRYVFQKEKESVWINPSAFLGALFYLLNLGTLQNFYVPFEMFPAAFAFIPWLFYFGLRYLRGMTKSDLVMFGLVVVLSSPMAYAATLWYASFAGLFLFLGTYALISSARKLKIKRFFILVATAILLSSYWIMPSVYSIVKQSQTISNANINRLFSQEAFLRNADYGDFKDLLLQKNFLFGWRNFDFATGKFGDLLGVWSKYLSNPLVLGVGYTLAGISVLGLVFGSIKREKVVLAFIPVLLFCLFFLLNINPPLGGLYLYLYTHFEIFAEGLRMPFTKFSILYELILSFYFGYLMFVIFTLKVRPLKVIIVFVKLAFFASTVSALIYFMLPAFYGQLIGSNVRASFPTEYNDLFKFLNSNSSGRVALMPINSKYGWEYRSWGYEGSGFLTFGTGDPMLYRDFDRWGSANEDFYSQASFALYSNDNQTFIDTLKKYQVKYLLLDESMVNPGGSSDTLRIPQIKNIAGSFGMKKVFNSGFLSVYKTGFGQEEGGISTPTKFTQIGENFSYSPVDPAYSENGDYVSSNTTTVRKVPILPSGKPEISEDLSVNRGFKDAYNCDLEKLGKVIKANFSEGILYRAEDGGASCDYLSYPDLKYNQAYILRIAGKNTAGRSLKIYLFNNSSETAELEEILPTGNFDENYFIYPKSVSGSGYTLNLETRSFGRLPSENILTKVEFYPVGSDYVQTFEGLPLQGPTLQNNLIINNVKKYGTWAYKVDVSGSGLLELGQGYEDGWKAFPTSNFQFKIFNLQLNLQIPNFKQELKHVKTNSWSNGWVVPAGSPSPFTLYLVYWPQLLEWGGLLVGVITLLVLVLSVRKK